MEILFFLFFLLNLSFAECSGNDFSFDFLRCGRINDYESALGVHLEQNSPTDVYSSFWLR